MGLYDGGTTTIVDCIIYGNVDPQIRIGLGSKLTISYSDVQGGLEGISGEIDNVNWGAGNIDKDPCFVRLGEWVNLDVIEGDYHLLSERGRYWPAHDVWVLDGVTSPCIDAGNPAVNPASERQPNGGRINMGAYGGTAYASMSKWAIAGDVNHDGIVNMLDFAIIAQSWLEHINQWPKVHITQPPDGFEFFWLTESVWIVADAWDVDGSVVKVEFFVNGGKIGEDNDGTDGWMDVTSFNMGTYVLTAKATDDKGATTTSPPVTITAVECP